MSGEPFESDELRTRRLALGFSQARLGQVLGLAPNTIARWERGELPIGSPRLVRLALDQLAVRHRDRSPRYVSEAPAPVTARSTVPHLPAPLIGRDREQAEIRALLSRSDVHLVTLIGPGGSGKTSLALEIANDRDGQSVRDVEFVELAPVRDPLLVIPSVAHSLGLQESPSRSMAQALHEYLQDQEVLLVLDNCEHVLPPVQDLLRLLSDCMRLQVLATSREPLRLRGEHRYPVPPLATPAVDHADWRNIARAPAVTLFERRAQSVDPGFVVTAQNARTVAEICVRLDSLPLAIELAAVRIPMFPPAAMLERLGQRLQFLKDGPVDAPQRHQTMRAAIDWSHALLSDQERTLFRRLTVFVGSTTLGAIEAVCSGDGLPVDQLADVLGGLVSKSMVQMSATDNAQIARYDLLDTLREYGGERLESAGEKDSVRARHLSWHVEAAEQIEDELWGPEQEWWADWLEREHANLRAALDWSQEHSPGEGLRLASALGRFWYMRGHLAEGAERLSVALRLAPESSSVRARAVATAAAIAYLRGVMDELRRYADNALVLAQQYTDQLALGWALLTVGIAWHVEGQPAVAEPYLHQSIEVFLNSGNQVAAEYSRYTLGEVTWFLGRHDEAVELMQQALDQLVDRNELFISGIVRTRLGHLRLLEGAVDQAIALQRENLTARWRRGDRFGIAESLCGLAWAASRTGDAEHAAVWLGAAENLWHVTGGAPPHEYGEEQEHAHAVAREQLGNAAFEAAWERGRATPLDEIVIGALEVSSPANAQSPAPTSTVENPLSPREQEVATLIGQGLANRAIANKLVISERTVEAHVDHIRQKLSCSSRAEIAVWAERAGLLSGHAKSRPD